MLKDGEIGAVLSKASTKALIQDHDYWYCDYAYYRTGCVQQLCMRPCLQIIQSTNSAQDVNPIKNIDIRTLLK